MCAELSLLRMQMLVEYSQWDILVNREFRQAFMSHNHYGFLTIYISDGILIWQWVIHESIINKYRLTYDEPTPDTEDDSSIVKRLSLLGQHTGN